MALTQISTAGVKDDAVTAGKIPANAVGNSELADDAVGIAELSATGTASSSTFLRGDNSWTTVNTDLVSDTSPQLGGDLDSNGHDISINSGLLEIRHSTCLIDLMETSTTNHRLRNGSGNFLIQRISDDKSTETTQFDIDGGTGAVSLYHNGTKKFETSSNGVTISGNPTINGTTNANGHITLPDHTGSQDGKLRLGTSNDLQIYHDGSDSYIDDAGLGDLKLKGSVIKILDTNNNAILTTATDGGIVVKHNNSTKFETYSGGVRVHGELLMQNNSLYSNDNAKLRLGTGQDLNIYHDGSNSYVSHDNGSGHLYLQGDAIRLRTRSATNNDDYIVCSQGGPVSIYHADVKKFETESAGISVIGEGKFAGHVYPSANNTYDLGTTTNRWRNIYTNDLNLSNEGSSNDIDSTWGDWTIQEGESDLFLKNNRSGKKYKFNLTEVS